LNHDEVLYQPLDRSSTNRYKNDTGTVSSVQRVPVSTRIKLIDFGGATYDDEKKSSVVNTRQYRAPEVILGIGWSFPSDLWCLVRLFYILLQCLSVSYGWRLILLFSKRAVY
jgi:serine/threonine protein kinase